MPRNRYRVIFLCLVHPYLVSIDIHVRVCSTNLSVYFVYRARTPRHQLMGHESCCIEELLYMDHLAPTALARFSAG